MSSDWFSAKLRKLCCVDDKAPRSAMDTIHVFRAEDFDDAFKRALEIGKATEEEYVNAEDEAIRWCFSEIVTLDIIRGEDMDCKEVYSEFVDLPEVEQPNLEVTLRPEDSKPAQTI